MSSSENTIDTDFVTITRHLNETGRKFGRTGELTNVLTAIVTSVKAIANSVRRAGIANLYGIAGETNATGDEQKKIRCIVQYFDDQYVEILLWLLRFGF